MHGTRLLKIGGKDRVFALNNYAIFFLIKELKCDVPTLQDAITKACEVNPMRGLCYIIYAGLVGHLESEAEFEHDVDLKSVFKWVADIQEQDAIGVWDCFKEVMQIPAASEEQIEAYAQAQKKRTTSKPK